MTLATSSYGACGDATGKITSQFSKALETERQEFQESPTQAAKVTKEARGEARKIIVVTLSRSDTDRLDEHPQRLSYANILLCAHFREVSLAVIAYVMDLAKMNFRAP